MAMVCTLRNISEKIKIDPHTTIDAKNNDEIIRGLEKITRNIEVHILPVMDQLADIVILKGFTIKDFEDAAIRLTYIKQQDFLNFIKEIEKGR